VRLELSVSILVDTRSNLKAHSALLNTALHLLGWVRRKRRARRRDRARTSCRILPKSGRGFAKGVTEPRLRRIRRRISCFAVRRLRGGFGAYRSELAGLEPTLSAGDTAKMTDEQYPRYQKEDVTDASIPPLHASSAHCESHAIHAFVHGARAPGGLASVIYVWVRP